MATRVLEHSFEIKAETIPFHSTGEKAAFPATECDKSAASSPELMECDVAIVGGGIIFVTYNL